MNGYDASDKYVIPFFIAVVLILCLSFFSGWGAADAGGKPDSPAGREKASLSPSVRQIGDIYAEGPHQQFACGECHKEESDDREGSYLSVNENSIGLCRTCHTIEHLHPVGTGMGTRPSGGSFPLPLGKGPLEGKIVCHTCHAMHRKLPNTYLLRGENAGYGQVRSTLCRSCHGGDFSGTSPHATKQPQCPYCHAANPQQGDSRIVSPDPFMQAACGLCHPDSTHSHYEGMNPFIDEIVRQQVSEKGSPAPDGIPFCSTCHDPHGGIEQTFLLTKEYFSRCAESRSVDPHWNDLLCLSCHRGEMEEKKSSLREAGDRNKICNRCHHSEYARTEIHPVGIAPSMHIRIPADMPLHEGRLTCVTCHDAQLQMGRAQKRGEHKRNPLFLRKKRATRNSFCFHCHIEETYKRLNPHIQLNANGEIREEACLFCHASLPDVRFIGPEKVSFIVQDPNEYCIGCHHGFTRNHPAGVMHLIHPSEKIMAAIRTSVQRIGVELPLFKGKIVCATCHNPHQEGVIKIAAAATGTRRENKLRLRPGRRQCTGCHWDK